MARKTRYVARRPRHPAAGAEGTRVVIEPVAPASSEPIEAELLDLSRQGMRIRAAVPFSVGETIDVRINQPPPGPALRRRGTVRWRRPEAQGGWSIGCQFSEPVDWETLGELFLNDVLSTDRPRSGPDAPPPACADAAVTETWGDGPSLRCDA
jgi:hypothetical protein